MYSSDMLANNIERLRYLYAKSSDEMKISISIEKFYTGTMNSLYSEYCRRINGKHITA